VHHLVPYTMIYITFGVKYLDVHSVIVLRMVLFCFLFVPGAETVATYCMCNF